MSLKPDPIPPIPQETAALVQRMLPRGTTVTRLDDILAELSTDEAFVDLYATVGQPGWSAWRLAVLLLLQAREGLTDRQTMEAAASRIDWRYVLRLAPEESVPGHTILSEFRTRLVTGSAEQRLLDFLLAACQRAGWTPAPGRQRIDATHVLAASRQFSRLELVGTCLQQGLDLLAQMDPDWLRATVPADWLLRYGRRIEDSRLPTQASARQQWAEQVGRDGVWLLAHLPDAWRELPAFRRLQQVWEQQYVLDPDQPPRWRSSEQLPATPQYICSVTDPDARYGHKRQTQWVGYKVDLTEVCGTDGPHLITAVQVRPACEDDSRVLPTVYAQTQQRGVSPGELLADMGYVDSQSLLDAEQQGVELLGPVQGNGHWQSQQQTGYALEDFVLDWEQQQARCPQGQTSTRWRTETDARGQPRIRVEFAQAQCQACPARSRCTRSERRILAVRPQAQHAALQAARQRQQTEAFTTTYRQRAGIEATMGQTTGRFGLRQARYVGRPKTELQAVLVAGAVNLERLDQWRQTGRAASAHAPSPFVRTMRAVA